MIKQNANFTNNGYKTWGTANVWRKVIGNGSDLIGLVIDVGILPIVLEGTPNQTTDLYDHDMDTEVELSMRKLNSQLAGDNSGMVVKPSE